MLTGTYMSDISQNATAALNSDIFYFPTLVMEERNCWSVITRNKPTAANPQRPGLCPSSRL